MLAGAVYAVWPGQRHPAGDGAPASGRVSLDAPAGFLGAWNANEPGGTGDHVNSGGMNRQCLEADHPEKEDEVCKADVYDDPYICRAVDHRRLGEGGASDDSGHGGAASGHGTSHGYQAIAFLLFGLCIGCLLQMMQERCLTFIPYTCLLFVVGVATAFIHHFACRFFGNVRLLRAVALWENIDPHLIFYVFLPALIFAEAMRLNTRIAQKLFWQILLLACPGVVMGAFASALFAYFGFLPYCWSWGTALTFGSILAATDPVAVVALFNTLGVSPQLTMLISGESLLNDGTAIVLFEITEKLMVGCDLSVWEVVGFFFQMTGIATILGVVLAGVALYIIAWCAETNYHSDAMIQVMTTICLGFTCFFMAENNVHTSGVLTVVSAGFVVSYAAWPRFASKETIHVVWESIGNTMVFILAGLLFGHRYLTRQAHLEMMDFAWMFLLYVAMMLIRAVMVLVLWPILNLIGPRISWREYLVIVWSGLRGAVGLVLAIRVDIDLKHNETIGSHFMFHIGGMALLTILINGTLAGPLLRKLGLTDTPVVEERVVRHLQEVTQEEMDEKLTEVHAKQFQDVNMSLVRELIPKPAHAEPGSDYIKLPSLDQRLQTYREIFLRAVEAKYWAGIDEGRIPRTSRIARILLFSTSDAQLRRSEKLSDWDFIATKITGSPCSLLTSLCDTWPLSKLSFLQNFFPSSDTLNMLKVYTVLSYIKAHELVQDEIPAYFGQSQIMDSEVRDTVAGESKGQCVKAQAELATLPTNVVEWCKARMLAGQVLHMHLEKVKELERIGILDHKGADHIVHCVLQNQRDIVDMQMHLPMSHRAPLRQASSDSFQRPRR